MFLSYVATECVSCF